MTTAPMNRQQRRAAKGGARKSTALPSTSNSQRDLPENCVRLSSGVVLRLRPYNRAYVQTMMAKAPAPKPPVIRNEELGIEEENIQDPTYKEKLAEHLQTQVERAQEFMFMLGTEIVEVPAVLPQFESEDWVAVCRQIGISLPKERILRYVVWLNTVAILTQYDRVGVVAGLARLVGTLEEDVANYMAFFPGLQGGAPNPEPGSAGRSADGDTVPPAAPGDGTGDGGA